MESLILKLFLTHKYKNKTIKRVKKKASLKIKVFGFSLKIISIKLTMDIKKAERKNNNLSFFKLERKIEIIASNRFNTNVKANKNNTNIF